MVVRQLAPSDAIALAALFYRLRDDPYFHPHPFTSEEALGICTSDSDYYCGAFNQTPVCTAYGMLRWGTFEHPSLGLAVHPEFRGLGLGGLVMAHLHSIAAVRGSTKIRLRVHPSNEIAQTLYRKIGYVFSGEDRGQLVGWYDV